MIAEISKMSRRVINRARRMAGRAAPIVVPNGVSRAQRRGHTGRKQRGKVYKRQGRVSRRGTGRQFDGRWTMGVSCGMNSIAGGADGRWTTMAMALVALSKVIGRC